MAIIIDDTQVFFGGSSFELIKGNFIDDNSPLVKAKPELFIIETKKEVKPKQKRATKKVEPKVEPKEELLIEEPVAALDVEETTEEKPKRKSRK